MKYLNEGEWNKSRANRGIVCPFDASKKKKTQKVDEVKKVKSLHYPRYSRRSFLVDHFQGNLKKIKQNNIVRLQTRNGQLLFFSKLIHQKRPASQWIRDGSFSSVRAKKEQKNEKRAKKLLGSACKGVRNVRRRFRRSVASQRSEKSKKKCQHTHQLGSRKWKDRIDNETCPVKTLPN